MARLTFRRWVFNILVALDVLLNAIRGAKKHEPISKRFARAREQGRWWGCWGCAVLTWIWRHAFRRPPEEDHCTEALKWDA